MRKRLKQVAKYGIPAVIAYIIFEFICGPLVLRFVTYPALRLLYHSLPH